MLLAGIGLLCSFIIIINLSIRIDSLEKKMKEIQNKGIKIDIPTIIKGY